MQQVIEAHTTQPGILNKLFYPAVIISSLFLLIPAFYNHYPFVNPDTATYLASGFIPETPFDRPITYGLFMRAFSINGLSLWLVIYAQALITSWLIFLIVEAVLGRRSARSIATATTLVVLLSVTTSLSWLVCQLQPDVFTAIGFLCIAVLLVRRQGRVVTVSVYVLYFLSVAMHMSHPLLFAGAAVCLLLMRRVYAYRLSWRPFALLFVCAALAIALMGAALSKSKHVFFTGTLLHKGVVQQYLAANCAVTNYKLCSYRAELTTDSDYFMWNPESPLYKIGGWQDAKPELTAIIDDVLTTPKYLQMYSKATIAQAAKQAVTFDIGGGNEPLDLATSVGQRISAYFPAEAAQYSRSRQNTQDIHEAFKIPNRIFAYVVCLSLLVLCYMLAKWRTLSGALKTVAVVCISGVLFNTLDCAAFGILHSRYGAKMISLLPMCAFLFLATTFANRNRGKVNQLNP